MKSPSCANIKGNDKLDPLFHKSDISEHSRSSSCVCHCLHFLLTVSKNTNNELGVGKDEEAVVRRV